VVSASDGVEEPESVGWAGIGEVTPRPGEDLEPLLAWLRTGSPTSERLDFPAGTALPDGRVDLCKQQLGPRGAARVTAALPRVGPGAEPPVRHLLLGTDGLGDQGAEAVAEGAGERGVQTLYLGCNKITAGGACRIATRLRASPQAVRAVWLKRNPLGAGVPREDTVDGSSAGRGPSAGESISDLIDAAPLLRTLDLVQTGLGPHDAADVVGALIAAAGTGREFERLYIGGNPLGPTGAEPLARLIAAGAVTELYASAAQLGSLGALVLADALDSAPRGCLRHLSLASNGIGARAAARLVTSAASAGLQSLDLGRVRAAGAIGAADNRLDAAATAAIGTSLAAHEHQLSYVVLTDCGMRSAEALSLLRHLGDAAAARTRFVLGKGIAGTVRSEFARLAEGISAPRPSADVAAIRSVYRTAAPS
jgi:hypothetical protein